MTFISPWAGCWICLSCVPSVCTCARVPRLHGELPLGLKTRFTDVGTLSISAAAEELEVSLRRFIQELKGWSQNLVGRSNAALLMVM